MCRVLCAGCVGLKLDLARTCSDRSMHLWNVRVRVRVRKRDGVGMVKGSVRVAWGFESRIRRRTGEVVCARQRRASVSVVTLGVFAGLGCSNTGLCAQVMAWCSE